MKNLISLLFVSIVLFSCQPENKNNVPIESISLSKDDMLKDYQIFKTVYQKVNSGIYKYHTPIEIDSVFTLNEKEITEQTTYRDFYNVIWNVIDYTRGCHNFLDYPDSLDHQLRQQDIFFPLPLKYINNRIYTNLEMANIPLGSELISINGIDSEKFAFQISRYASVDGFNETGKYADIETSFLARNIYYAIGPKKCFDIEYKSQNAIAKKVRLQSVRYNDFENNYENRHSKELEENSVNYSYQSLDSIHAGLLTVSSFIIGGPESKKYKKYALFLDSVFHNLKFENIKNLIVDLRNNEGGFDPCDLLLFSYLTKRSFRENKSACTFFNKVPLKEYYLEDYEGEMVELNERLEKEYPIIRNGKNYQDSSYNMTWFPNKNTYNGKIILLINPFVASAGSLFASMVKSDQRAFVIGEETLGGYYGHTGHIPVSYQLPNSKLIIKISIVDLKQDVQELPDQKLGDGVKPDKKISQAYEDFLKNKDTQLNYAIKVIKNPITKFNLKHRPK